MNNLKQIPKKITKEDVRYKIFAGESISMINRAIEVAQKFVQKDNYNKFCKIVSFREFKYVVAQLDTDYFISLNKIDKNLILVESDGYFYPQIYATAEFSHLENQVIGLRRLKYVHELQNLFFALVREELKTT